MKRRAAFHKLAAMLLLDIPTLSNKRLTALFFAVALLIAQSAPAVASYISYPFVFSPNTIADPNQVNSDFNAIIGVVNGGLDSTNFATNTGLTLQQISGYSPANCRLTLQSGTPVISVTNSGTLYLDPWQGNTIGLYNPSIGNFIGYPLTNEISLLGNTTNFPTANTMYWISVHWNGTAIVFDNPTVWTSAVIPSTTQTINGVVCAAGTGASRIVGAVYWDGTAFHDYGWQRLVSNLPQNCVARDMNAQNNGTPTIATAASWNYYNGAAAGLGNNQLQYCKAFVDTIVPTWQASVQINTQSSAPGSFIGIGVDSSTSPSGGYLGTSTVKMANSNSGEITTTVVASFAMGTGQGYHVVNKIAMGTGSAGAVIFQNDNLTFSINN